MGLVLGNYWTWELGVAGVRDPASTNSQQLKVRMSPTSAFRDGTWGA